MIKGLRLRIALLAVAISFVTLALILLGINVINYNVVLGESDKTLNHLVIEKTPIQDAVTPPDVTGEPVLPPFNTHPSQFESRYFRATVVDGQVVSVDLSHIGSVDELTAVEYTEEAIERGTERGFVSSYRYLVTDTSSGASVIMLDVGRRLNDYYSFLTVSISVTLLALLLLSVIAFLFAGRIARPIEEANERQKRFITDAGHELKTPIAIISANVDLLADEIGENESLADIGEQANRLRVLTEELVYLSRLDEGRDVGILYELPLSEVVADAAAGFTSLAEREGKRLSLSIAPDISVVGDTGMLAKLVAILLDNAIKYSRKESLISLELSLSSRDVTLSVTNEVERPLDDEAVRHVFDRFWRADSSRSGASGHGIGLSVAEAIVNRHSGRIAVESRDSRFIITVSLQSVRLG